MIKTLRAFSPFRCAIAFLVLSPLVYGSSEPTADAVAQLANPSGDRMDWFRTARFGMFIHWGLYSIPAGQWPGRKDSSHAEWIMEQEGIPSAEYEKLAPQFDPTKFDAKAWVKVAKDAGMRYVVFTAKHHDGFSMYATRQTHYNIVDDTPFGRDPLKEIAAACKEAGLVFCVYYSIQDWHHPDSPTLYSWKHFHGDPNPNADIRKYDKYMRDQVRELLTNYGPVGLVWFDEGGAFNVADRNLVLQAREMADMIHQLQPKALINSRLGVDADYGTPEQKIPAAGSRKPFEVCMTLNDHWGFNKADHNWKTPETVIGNIADIFSKGGNYLLNVGPTASGVIPDEAVQILKEVGTWMSANAPALYPAAPNPLSTLAGVPDPGWRCTTSPGKLFFILIKAQGGTLTLPSFKNRVVRASILSDPAHSPLVVQGRTISLPAQLAQFGRCPVVCVEIEGTIDGS